MEGPCHLTLDRGVAGVGHVMTRYGGHSDSPHRCGSLQGAVTALTQRPNVLQRSIGRLPRGLNALVKSMQGEGESSDKKMFPVRSLDQRRESIVKVKSQ